MTKSSRRKEENERVAFDDGAFDVSSLRQVEVHRGRPKSSLAVRFDASDLERLRQRADAEGVGVTQLVRQWVIERLDEPDTSGAVADLLDALDKSVRVARAIRRSDTRRAG